MLFNRFPKNSSFQSKWIEVIVNWGCSQDNIVKHSSICSLHFEVHCILTNGFAPSRLKAGAVPTLFFNEVKESVADTEDILPDTHGNDTPAIKAEVVDKHDEDVTESTVKRNFAKATQSGNVQTISRKPMIEYCGKQTPGASGHAERERGKRQIDS
ncbi:uncharacterized protein LOC117609767 [Osmia lignaria lignaria]|uniref:uncharacterized protein LOC117609767 n=1 Tax=Osmia lignaria lignaria TaxID=1437193 RepID=UPI0014785EB6|nr:uncharacterized protein LOC117609767 [Osmia lignaria]